MKSNRVCLICGIMFVGGCLKVASAAPPGASVDPQAKDLLLRVRESVSGAERFELKVNDTIDTVLDSGQKIQFAHQRTFTVSRPSKLKVVTRGDRQNTEVYFDGTTFTWHDPGENVYAQLEVPGTIDNLLDTLHQEYDLQTPLADLLYSDLFTPMLDAVTEGRQLGRHLVGERMCHHLAFRQSEIDWQIWIEDQDPPPRVRKLLITYKRISGQPQFTAYIEGRRIPGEIPEETFQFVPPRGCEKIDFVPMEGMKPERRGANQ